MLCRCYLPEVEDTWPKLINRVLLRAFASALPHLPPRLRFNYNDAPSAQPLMHSIGKMFVIQFGCTEYRKVARRDTAEQLCLVATHKVS